MDKFANWLDGLTKSWTRWWKIRGLKVNIFDEETPKKKKSNPFYWIGGMLYILLILQVVVGIVLTFYYVPDTSPVEKVDPSKVMYGHGLTIEGAMKEAEEFRVKIDAGEMTEDELLTQEEITQRDEEKAALTTDAEKALVDTKWATITSQRKDILAMEGKTPEEIVADLGVIVSKAYISVADISGNPVTRTIRGIHRYGAYCFIALLMLRWLRMYFNGEFKKPGELTWIIATLVVCISTFSGVTGYLLPFDQRSYWATTVGTQMLDTVDLLPGIGPLGLGAALKFIGLGAHQVGQTTILRFNILHYLLPIAMFLAAELYFIRSRKKRPKLNWVMFAILAIVIIGAILYLPAISEPPPNTVKTPDHILPDW
ncbi:MAG TPA: cytochrome b N-terminal domain-containing protein, partial [Caldisericia bacterium]|nr:cytochrome b N-terminal domain-containing protein [Caldisericia bacterium]